MALPNRLFMGLLDRWGMGGAFRDAEYAKLVGQQAQPDPSTGILATPLGQNQATGMSGGMMHDPLDNIAGVDAPTGTQGTGLLGGQFGYEEFLNRAGALGGRYADNQMKNAASYVRDDMARDWLANNTTAYQEAQLMQQAAAAQKDHMDKAAQFGLRLGGDYQRITEPLYMIRTRVENIKNGLRSVMGLAEEQGGRRYGGDWATHSSNALDTEFLSTLAQINDPSAVVSEGGVRQGLQGLGWSEALIKQGMDIFRGKGLLTPRQRRDILRVIMDAEKTNDQAIDAYDENLGSYGRELYGQDDAMVAPVQSTDWDALLGAGEGDYPLPGAGAY